MVPSDRHSPTGGRASSLILEGTTLRLREWRANEPDAMHRWLGDPQVTRFLSWGSQTRADSERHLQACIDAQHARKRRQFFRAIEERASGRVVGDAGFEWCSAQGAPLEGRLGYFLEPPYWGRGFACEAAGLLLAHAFGLAAGIMSASCDVRNSPSERVMQKCGLLRAPDRETPGRREYRITRAQWKDLVR
jgi:RimJ/RimL family protein N-acetyltransferase